MIHAFIGTKYKQSQLFDKNGHRIPVTVISAQPCVVTQVKTTDADGYSAIQIASGSKRKISKPLSGHVKKAGLDKKAPRFFREIRVADDITVKAGDEISVDQVLYPGDIVSVTGISKGKGFAGVMKRHKFAGGPATHGQSDRARAPGSIGGTTEIGRVFRGKKMAGRMGSDTITVKNLEVVAVDAENQEVTVSGLVPGPNKALVTIAIMKKADRPEPTEEVAEDTVSDTDTAQSEEVAAESTPEGEKKE